MTDYWDVVKEIEELVANKSTYGLQSLRYLRDDSESRQISFGGNFSFVKRLSYFDRENDVVLPCGFFTDLPLAESGK